MRVAKLKDSTLKDCSCGRVAIFKLSGTKNGVKKVKYACMTCAHAVVIKALLGGE